MVKEVLNKMVAPLTLMVLLLLVGLMPLYLMAGLIRVQLESQGSAVPKSSSHR
jgi:hypothetical protein